MKDISCYIKKSGVINSKYVSWNSYALQNDQFFFLSQISKVLNPNHFIF